MLKVINGGKTPTKGSKYSAAIDLYANEDVVIGAGETAIIGLGVCIDLDLLRKVFISNLLSNSPTTDIDRIDDKFYRFMRSHYLQLEPRSSLRAKGLQAGTGVIDLDFTQEIKIILHNPVVAVNLRPIIIGDDNTYIGDKAEVEGYGDFTRGEYHIKKGDKIAQIMLKEHKTYLMGINTEDERSGGFGSTGA